ncbi:MAG TPA: ABC transporter substrate-binding protein [Streptosporangiaceae bacterium]|nr:ABC transporter substrate-binding protein [Streptosporangiaceae bacterium]
MDRSDESESLIAGAALGRRQFLRGVAATSAIVGAGGFLTACSGSSASTSTGGQSSAAAKPKRGGDLKVGLTGGGPTDTVDPHKGITYLDSSRLQSLYSPLVQLNANAELEYMLAESITPNGNFTKWTVKLRQGVTFHDGKPLTAQDVVFTLNRILSNQLSGSIPLGPVDIKNTKAVDTHTVQIAMTKPYSSFVTQLAASWVYLYIAPVGFNPAKPVGTGPFMFKSLSTGQRSVFTRNPHYWRNGLPYADTLEILDFANTVSLAAALQTGQIHAAGTLDGPQIATLDNASGIKAIASKGGGIVPFTMRVDTPPFNDVRVRQAMRLLVDRAQLIDSALDGHGSLASDVFSPFDQDFNAKLVRHTDVDQAKFLLKQAGKQDLTVTLTTSAIATGTVAMATVLAEQAKAAGVKINVSNVPSGTFFGKQYLQWPFAQDYYNYFPYLPQVAESMLKDSPFNETHTNDPTYTKWYDQANATATGSSLGKELLFEMQNFDFNKGGYIIPAYVDALDAYSTKIAGFQAARIGQPLSDFDMEHWFFV